ncbi:hypothetical protein CN333_00075 [Bacillus thuringiensis]|uniref:YopX family protein n=1 Tax=Bacillus thuringiensis TaxID=1428 RepID=UPI000BFA6E7A|nr:YopX family protein [Bacillus thuringiensis]PFE80027.1 hypothetical protein CN333_00075 [Bacillus thuringiensis]
MREIKFRGRKINTNKWVVGNLGYTKTSGGNSGILVDGKLHIVDSETVGQYTGLTDNNGREIYEGDILKYGYIITYIDGSDTENLGMDIGFYSQRDDFESWALLEVGAEYEVIGNIYESENSTK